MWCWSHDKREDSDRISIYDGVCGQMWACNDMLLLFFPLYIMCVKTCKSLVNSVFTKRKKHCRYALISFTSYIFINRCPQLIENIINNNLITHTWYLLIDVCREFKQIGKSDFVLMEAVYLVSINLKG